MAERALALVARASSTHAAWTIIDKTFQTQTQANRMHLKIQLQNITKGSLSMMEYIEKKRAIADTLADNLSPISDEDLIGHILAGLDSTYGPFHTSFMMHRSSVTTVDDLVGLLLHEESKLEREHQRQAALLPTPPTTPLSGSTPTAHAAVRSAGNRVYSSPSRAHSSPGRTTPRGNNPRRYKGSSSSTGFPAPTRFSTGQRQPAPDRTSTMICQLCGRENHVAIDCFQRGNQTDYPSRYLPPRDQGRQANVAQHSSSSVVDPSWYFDTGATDHVTPDLGRLYFTDDYTGVDKLQVGDGQDSTSRGHQ
ncbi:Retrovirus-related Pol polyprotein from transposon RE1 [Linum perenne]